MCGIKLVQLLMWKLRLGIGGSNGNGVAQGWRLVTDSGLRQESCGFSVKLSVSPAMPILGRRGSVRDVTAYSTV